MHTPSTNAHALPPRAARWWIRLLLLAIVLPLSPSSASAASADPATEMNRQARDLYELGMAHYRARGFSEAVRAFESAYQLDPQREILFALAQATRMSGDCPAAVPLYERFLATHPPARQVEATRIALRRCHERAAIEAAVKTRPPDSKLALDRAPPPPAAVFTSPPPPRPRPAWYRDPATSVLAAAAAVSSGAGVGLLVAARLADREHRDAASYGQADERHAAAQNRQRWAATALLTGAAFTVAAGARWAWLRVSSGRREIAVALGTGF